MSDLQRVPGPPAPLGGRGDLAAIGLIVVIAILIAKPWGGTSAQLDTTPPPTDPTVTATVAPTPVEAGYAYDQSIFGPFEPRPEWSIWPAGFFVTVLYVTREAYVPATDVPSPAPSNFGSPRPTGGSGPTASATAEPGWPATVTIGPGDHLLWLGLNTPRSWAIREVRVWRRSDDGGRAAVPVVELPSRWGPYFTIIGIPVAPGSERLTIWPMGTYDLEVTLDPDGSKRSILVEIQTLDPSPSEGSDERPR